jgi:short-subunit dehydrogenase
MSTAVVTGASVGIGAAYADRFARRGFDLLLVARNKNRLDELAAELTGSTGRKVEILAADLTDPADLRAVEERLRTDEDIDVLVNNAGGAAFSPLADADLDALENLITLNVTSLTRLSAAAASAFAGRRHGTIVNISSVLALNLLPTSAVYSATKSFVLTLSQSLQQELADQGVRVQVVLPGALRTALWDGSGIELSSLPTEIVMEVGDAVDAALAGLDNGETVTILSLPDIADWDAYVAARDALVPNLSLPTPAPRYTS